MARQVDLLVVHCSATKNGQRLSNDEQSAAERINDWHRAARYRRADLAVKAFNPHLKHIGYHYVIDTDGRVETGRGLEEVGAHAKGHNSRSVGICLVGGVDAEGGYHGEYTEAQWQALHQLLRVLQDCYPQAKICGHRDLSPDVNGNGIIEPREWVKACPCFDVWAWLHSEEAVNTDHLYREEA